MAKLPSENILPRKPMSKEKRYMRNSVKGCKSAKDVSSLGRVVDLWCCDWKSRAACAQSFAPWQEATIEITRRDHSIIACSRHIHNGVILHAHPVRGELHNQRNTTGKVATMAGHTRSSIWDCYTATEIKDTPNRYMECSNTIPKWKVGRCNPRNGKN